MFFSEFQVGERLLWEVAHGTSENPGARLEAEDAAGNAA
jgi:hypothetical protein